MNDTTIPDPAPAPARRPNQAQRRALARLRVPFPAHQVSTKPVPYRANSPADWCPECGEWHALPAQHLSFVGHAALTHRLLDVDPEWHWEPLATDARGLPAYDDSGGLWIRLSVCGITRLGYGDSPNKFGGNAVKERIGDALRNAGMRFGMALELWHKGGALEAEAAPAPAAATVAASAAAVVPLTADDVAAVLAALAAAADLAALKAAFGDVWSRADEAQRITLKAAYDARKLVVDPVVSLAGPATVGPATVGPVVPAAAPARRVRRG
jgi:hypothetical protein